MANINFIPKIVQLYRADYILTQDEFAEKLYEAMDGATISKQAVSYWENGKTRPKPIFLMRVARRYTDWRRNFALDCLAALEPGVYEPTGAIGREILSTPTTPSIAHNE